MSPIFFYQDPKITTMNRSNPIKIDPYGTLKHEYEYVKI